MRKNLLIMTIALVICLLPVITKAEKKGGATPCLIGCCLGPRIGLEYNEGKPVKTSEWLQLIVIGYFINCFDAYQKNGCTGCLLEAFIGSRVGRQYHQRNVRTMEWIGIIPGVAPITNLIMSIEAYEGKTMTEIEQQEHLKK